MLNDINMLKANIQPINELVSDMQRVKGAMNKLHDDIREQKEDVNKLASIVNNLNLLKTANSVQIDESNMELSLYLPFVDQFCLYSSRTKYLHAKERERILELLEHWKQAITFCIISFNRKKLICLKRRTWVMCQGASRP